MTINFTNKLRTVFLASMTLLCGVTLRAQTFTQETSYVDYLNYGDTIHLDITSPAAFAYGTATITIYYEGDYGGSDEFISLYGEDNNLIGNTHPYFDGSDCMADSATFTFPASLINNWSGDNVLKFYGLATNDVDFFCTTSHTKIKLTYNHCLQGPIALLSLPQTSFCSIDNPVTISANPAGGTFSGPNFSAAGFDPQGMTPGVYTLTYTFTNGSGCTSTSFVNVTIKDGTVATSDKDTVCVFETATLTAVGTGHTQWFSDLALTNNVGSGNIFNTPALTNTSTYYSTTVYTENYFEVENFTTHDSVVIDHDGLTGDDRGGIAVTSNYIYVVGDDSTARFDLNLQNGVTFPRMDGLFSDLGNGQLYTLYNPVTGIPDADNIDSMYITQLRTLNDDLTLGSGIITLSDSIAFGWDSNYNYQSGVFAGNGFLVLFSSPESKFYAIDLQDGFVTDLGSVTNFVGYYSETWAFWGIAEFTQGGYSAVYRDDNGNSELYRYDILNQTRTNFATFNDLGDMTSFTYAPWNNRWYFHVEGGTDFDPNYNIDELLGYANASDTTGGIVNVISPKCPAAVTVVVDRPIVTLTGGTTICNGATPITLTATPSGGLFSGPGVAGSTFTPSTAGLGIHDVIYTYTNAAGCSNSDTTTFNVNCTVGIDEVVAQNINLYPNPASEILFVNLGDLNSQSILKVFDTAGRLIINQSSNGSGTIKLDVSSLREGAYILQISGEINTIKVFVIAR